MARKSSWNPIAFVPTQVTIISTLVYIALFVALIWVHTNVPSAPTDPTPVKGINLTQAWLDLDFISDGFHPYNSKRNEVVRDYLLGRVEGILKHNGAGYKVDGDVKSDSAQPVTIFKDDVSNVTFVDDWRGAPWTCYAESQNIIVYIRGEDDEPGDWWNSSQEYDGQGGVLVNAHYDSVSTGYGATDDGVGVVTVLQLISYFTKEGHRPKRGVVALLNNGEEDGLYGAHAYLRHPISQFPHTFLNLEGAGAGGRATLFRSTDAEVTKFYASSPYPFGTVISGDGFKRGLVRSGTDYSVFTQDLGMRGLDVAFMEPRARYHTNQDDVRDTSPDSLWHMLSASLETMKAMTSYDGDEFEGKQSKQGRLETGTGSDGVWFDVFGRALAVMKLPTLFALSVTLLVAGPLMFLVLEIVLSRADKWYPFAGKRYLHNNSDEQAVQFSALRGFFRFPIVFVVATAAAVALAYLVTKINPYIVYKAEYVVWVMMLSLWFSISWFLLRMADHVRPTALSRMYTLLWVYALSWIALVLATVGENNYQIASGYFMVIYNASVFVALLISYLELFAVPTKAQYVEHVAGAEDEYDARSTRAQSISSRRLLDDERPASSRAVETEGEDANERTSLLRGGDRRTQNTFTNSGRRRHPEDDGTLDESGDPFLTKAYGDEQAWSSSLPQWTWIVQFIVLAPINIILVGQIALLMTSALYQTPADGNPVLPIYLMMAGLSVLLLLPLTPFLHRFTFHIPTLVFLVFIGCLIYNLLAFPFSREARLKHYFVQQVDLNSGVNNVSITGLDGYIQDIAAELPSAAGQHLQCGYLDWATRSGLQSCVWHGLTPLTVPTPKGLAPYRNKTHGYEDWLSYNITHSGSSAVFRLTGKNTKACRIIFDNPVSQVEIDDAAHDPRYHTVAEDGSTQIRLFSRDWDKTFRINVTWDGQEAGGQTGKAVCLWSDANQLGTIPALDEVKKFEPVWSAVTKGSDGLVEGFKDFKI